MTEMNAMQTTTAKLLELADKTSEGFVLSITAAYLAGKAAGRTEALAEKAS